MKNLYLTIISNELKPDSAYSIVRLLVTVFIASVINIGMWAIIIILPNIQEEFSLERSEVSIIYAFNMLGFAIGNFFMGKLVDRIGITRSLIVASILVGAGFILSAYSSSLVAIAIFHVGIGFGTATGFGPLIADISHWFSKRRGVAVALVASGNYFSGAMWPIILSALNIELEWRLTYLIFGFCCLFIVIPSALLLIARPSQSYLEDEEIKVTKVSSGDLMSSRMLLIFLGLAAISCCVAMSMPQIHIVALCVDLGFSLSAGTEILSFMLLGGVVSRIVSGLATDKFGAVNILLLGSILQCAGLFLYLPSDGLVSLYVVSLVFGLAQGGIVPSYAVIVRQYFSPREAASKVGLVMMATIVGMAFGGWLSGWIFDYTGSYKIAFINGIVWNLLNITIIFLVFFNRILFQRSA